MTRSKPNRGPSVAPAGEEVSVVTAEVRETETAAPKKVSYVVSGGKSLSTKRGIRGPGQDVIADELAGGEEYLEHLARTGFLEVK